MTSVRVKSESPLQLLTPNYHKNITTVQRIAIVRELILFFIIGDV